MKQKRYYVIQGGIFDNLNLKRVHTQPEIINPKTGKPFNLKDPEFPVIDDPTHTFKWNYWGMPRKIPTVMISYLEERWAYFNKHRFHGALKKPNIVLLKDVSALKMRLRGLWNSSSRELSISPNLFNPPHEGWVNRTLIHEMCHQSEFEKFGSIEQVERGHGPRWRHEMSLAGLTPNRFDDTKNETYADQKEKVFFEKRERIRQPATLADKVLEETRIKLLKPKVGDHVLFSSLQGIIYGKLAQKATKAGYWLVVVTEEGGTVEDVWTLSGKSLYQAARKDIESGRFEA